MSFFAILFALLLEQVRPLGRGNPVYAALRAWSRWVRRNFDTGRAHHGGLAWVLAVLLPSAVALGVHWLLIWFAGWPFAVLWSVVVLYLTLGFRQFSHHFTDIRDALDAGDEERARQLLALWQQVDASELPKREIVRHVIEYSVLAAHRHVFGVLCWFSILAALGLGPAGAVMYRLSEFVARYWKYQAVTQQQPVSPALQAAASQAWWLIDWLPARITALGFAVVGSFEDAIDAWRSYVLRHPQDNDGVVLAATAGAINVRLGGEALKSAYAGPAQTGISGEALDLDTGSTDGREPELAHLRSVVGLVWRTVVMWLVLLALLTLARLLG
jgi:adenosylcobinamide-phosphate synthase